VRGSPAWREKEDLLASVPGVGPITARTLIAELPELGTLDGKRIASLAACRHNSVLKAFRQRLIDAGKPKMLIAIASARKLLTILNAILRDKRPWRPENA
jgi:transposase